MALKLSTGSQKRQWKSKTLSTLIRLTPTRPRYHWAPSTTTGCSAFLLPPANEVWGKVRLFTPVCYSVHGVCYPSMHCRWYPSMPCRRVLSQHALQVVSQHALQVVSQHALQGVCYPSMHCRWYPSMPCRGSTLGVPGTGGAWSQQGACSWGVPGGEPPQTATAVGSTHPTGMHSC